MWPIFLLVGHWNVPMDTINFTLFKVIPFRFNIFKETLAQVGEEVSIRRF